MSEGGGLLAPPDGTEMEVDPRPASAAVVPPAAGPAESQPMEQAVEQQQPQLHVGGAVDRIEEGDSGPLSSAVLPSLPSCSGEKRNREQRAQEELDTATQRAAALALNGGDGMEHDQGLEEGSGEGGLSLGAVGQGQEQTGKAYEDHRDSYVAGCNENSEEREAREATGPRAEEQAVNRASVRVRVEPTAAQKQKWMGEWKKEEAFPRY